MAKSKEELIELLKSNIKAFNSYRKEARLDKIDFSGSDLSVANLCRADLSNTTLRNCDLSFSYLHSANLSYADLTDLTLGRADMTEVNLSNAVLDNANLSNTILYGANISGASAKCIILEGSKIRESNLSEADLYGSNLTNLDLSGVNFNKTNLKGANLSGANLSNSINLQHALFDEDTIWPTEDKLPKDFIPSMPKSTFEEDDNDYQVNSDFGVGVYSENTDFEFLDFPGHKDIEEELNMQNTVTEIGYKDKKESHQEESDLPIFEDFPELPDLDSFEDNIDLQDDDDDDKPQTLEEDDSLHEVFNLSLKQIAESEPTQSTISSSITQQNFSVKPTETASNMAPTMGAAIYAEPYQQPVTTYDPHVNEKLDSIMTILGNLVDKLEVIENEQKDQREYINNIKVNLQQEQKEHLTNLEHTIEQEHKTAIELIKKSQEEDRKAISGLFQGVFKDEHTSFLSDIKEAVDANQIKELVSEKVDFISSITKNNIDRLESKIDIIAQTDPLDQMDAMISELSDSIHSEQENLELKINELTTISESVVSLLEMISFNPTDKIDLTSVSSGVHEMLENLESNIRQDQDKLDQKIDDLSVMLDNMNHTLFNINSQVKNKDDNILLKSIQLDVQQVTKDIFDVNDLANNMNTTLGALVDLSSPAEVLDAIAKSKSEIVTKHSALEEKLNDVQNNIANNHSAIELSLQQEFSKSLETINLLNNDFNIAFEKYNSIQELLEAAKAQLVSIEQKTEALGSDSFMNLSELITALTEKIELQINHIEQNSQKVIGLFEDSVKKANQSFNDNIANVQNTVKTEFIGINQKIEQIISNDDITNQKIQVLKQILEDIFEKETTTNNNVILSNQKMEYVKDLMNGDYETSKANFIQLNKKLEEMDSSIEKIANEPKIDDEIRSIFEHLLYLSEKNSKTGKDSINYLIQKMEANELALQNSLQNLDKRISKVNSIVRNVYKSLDGITDLITGEGSSGFRLPKLSNDFSDDAPVHSRKYDRRTED